MSNSLFETAITRLLETLEVTPLDTGVKLGIFSSESQRQVLSDRLAALLPLATNSISQQQLVENLFHGLKESSTKVQLSQFVSATAKLAAHSGFTFTLQTDRAHGKPLAEKQCLLEVSGLESMLVEKAMGNEAQLILRKQANEAIHLRALPDTPLNIFVSVAEKDLVEAKDLITRLEGYRAIKKLNCNLWLFKRELIGGDDFHPEIQRAIADCDMGLLLLSQYFYSSTYIMKSEYTHFYPVNGYPAPTKPPLPVMLKKLEFGDLPHRHIQVNNLQGRAYAELTTDVEKDAFAAQLADNIKGFITKRVVEKKNDLMQTAFALVKPNTNDKASKDIENILKERVSCKAALTGLGDESNTQPIEEDDPQPTVDIQEYLQEWVANKPQIPYLAILGEYGMGKTWACLGFVQTQLEAHKANPQQPTAIYLDLRRYNEGAELTREATPTLAQIIETTLVRQVDILEPGDLSADMVIDLVRNQGAIVVFDGLDEVANHLSPAKRVAFFNQLAAILPANHVSDRHQRFKKPGKILFSCRSNLFTSLSEETNLFMKQQRDGQQENHFEVLRILPFTEQQIREYISRNLPGRDIDQVMDLLNQVHNLRELAERPYNLSLLRHQIDRLEQQREAGQAIFAVTLYQNLVQEWLERDEGKHIISKDHKPKIMMALAAHLTRLGQRSLSHGNVAEWLDEWLAQTPAIAGAYTTVARDDLKADLRTATFIVRPNSDQFQFAHTSLLEYFLAEYLIQALEKNTLAHWTIPEVSAETFDFMVQLLQSDPKRLAKAQQPFQALLEHYQPEATELALRFWLRVQDSPIQLQRPARMDCTGASLANIAFVGHHTKPLNLNNCDFSKARLGFSTWKNVQLNGSRFTGAQLPSAEFIDCYATQTDWQDARLCYSQWRKVNLQHANFMDADLMGTRIGFCDLTAATYPQEGVNSFWHNNRGGEMVNIPANVAQTTRLAHVLLGHSDSISSVAFSPDGKQLLTGSRDQTAKLWDTASGALLLSLRGHSYSVTSVAFSPDGKQLLTGSDDDTAKLWDTFSGALLLSLQEHTNSVTSVAFSPDGKQLLTGSNDDTAKLWDASSGTLLLNLQGHTNSVTSATFSPDGKQLLTGSDDDTAKLWDTSSGALLLSLQGHSSSVNTVAFSSDGKQILTGSDDSTAKLWDASSGVLLLSLQEHSYSVSSVAFSPDGKQLLTGSYDDTAKLWDASSGALLLNLQGHTHSVTSVAFSPDGKQLLTGSDDNTAKLWDASSGAFLLNLQGHFYSVNSAAFSPDSKQLLIGAHDDTAKLWDASSGVLLLSLREHSYAVTSVAFSPDGKQMLTGSYDDTARLWDVSNGKLLLNLLGHSSSVYSVAFSPDGKQLLTGSYDETAKLWDASNGKLLVNLLGHSNSVNSVAFSPDGKQLLTGSFDHTVKLWDASSGKLLLNLQDHSDWIRSVAFSPDGKQLLTGSDDNTVKLWDATSGMLLQSLQGHINSVISVAFSPDGKQLLTGSFDDTAKLWDATSGDLLLNLQGHTNSVTSVAFSPDGKQLLTGSRDGTTKTWDARTGGEILTIYALPDEQYLAVNGNEFTAASPEAWRYACYKLEIEDAETGHRNLVVPAEAIKPLPVV